MVLRFCTKRNVNGNRKVLIIDGNNKSYNDQNNRIFIRSDFVEVSAGDLKNIKDLASKSYIYDPELY